MEAPSSPTASSPQPLAGQHAFITGGGSGIGLGAAQAMIADGALVTIVGRTEATLRDAAEQLGEHASIAIGDVGDEASVAAAVEQANDRAPLTIAVANAGRGGGGPLLHLDLDTWDDTLRTNLTGTFLTFKHAAQALRANGGGAMCAVSSIAGVRTHRFFGAYSPAKAGVNNLVENAADELGSLGIRVNAVAPGLVETDLSMSLQSSEEINGRSVNRRRASLAARPQHRFVARTRRRRSSAGESARQPRQQLAHPAEPEESRNDRSHRRTSRHRSAGTHVGHHDGAPYQAQRHRWRNDVGARCCAQPTRRRIAAVGRRAQRRARHVLRRYRHGRDQRHPLVCPKPSAA